MARGWESKAVEEQQMERERGRADRRPSVADPAAARHRQGLELARARIVADLAEARSAAHRQMLETALADLDKQLAATSAP